MKIGAKIAMQQDEGRENPKNWPKNTFFLKRAQDFELLKQVPQSSHQTGHLGWNQYIGTLILSYSAFPSGVN